jgi:membrane protein implicated in regulation of membrane protease activity
MRCFVPVLGDRIEPGGRGKLELRGSTWDARNVGDTALSAGSRCLVQSVDGLTLHVRAED